jgi:hypothetical protein
LEIDWDAILSWCNVTVQPRTSTQEKQMAQCATCPGLCLVFCWWRRAWGIGLNGACCFARNALRLVCWRRFLKEKPMHIYASICTMWWMPPLL